MAQIIQYIEMQRGGWNASGTAGTYNEIRDITTRLNTADFDGTVTYYFEASLNNTGAEGTTTAYAQLYNRTDGTAVANSEISTTQNNGFSHRIRSGSISLSGDKVYSIRLKHSNNTSNTQTYSARIIVIQSGTITKTQIHHELGNEVGSSSTSDTYRYPETMKFLYEAARYDGTVTIKHAAVLKATSGNTTYSGLYDETAGAVVSNSTASTTSTTAVVAESGAITLIDGHVYRPTGYVSGGTGVTFESNKIIFTITDFTKYLAYISVLSPWTSFTTTDTTYTYEVSYQQGLDAANYSGCTVQHYFDALLTISNASATATCALVGLDMEALEAIDISGGEVTNTGSTTENRVRSGQLTLMDGLQVYGVAIKSSISTATAGVWNACVVDIVSFNAGNDTSGNFFQFF